MRIVKLSVVFIIVISLFASMAQAQALVNQKQIGLRFGYYGQTGKTETEVGIGGVKTSVGTGGALGGLFYGHSLAEGLALQLDIGGMTVDMEAEVSVLNVSTSNAYVGHVLVGVKHYFPKSHNGSSVRPFGRISIGPYIGSQSQTEVGLSVTVKEKSATTFGGQLGAGLEFILSRHFAAGINLGYHLMADFGESIGGRKNYSGVEFSFAFSYLFGHGGGSN